MARAAGRGRQWAVIVAVVGSGALAAIGLASVSVVPEKTLTLTSSGRPVAGATVAYHLHGQRFNPVCSSTIERPGGVATSGDDGRVTLPSRLVVHRPRPLEGPFIYMVDLVYAPALHTARGPFGRLTEPSSTFDWEAGRIELEDNADRPQAWFDSLLQARRWSRSPRHPAAAAVATDLDRDVVQFLARHRDTLREIIPPPETWSEDRRAESIATQEESIASTPTWGPLAEHMFRRSD